MVGYGIGAWLGTVILVAISGDKEWAILGISILMFALIMDDFAKEVKKK